MRTQSATITITRAVTVAAGVFAPGHLGELTQYLPFELVDDVLEQTKTVQRRLRDLPSRVGVYFVLALGMFPRLGYARVWAKLTAGLAGLDVPLPVGEGAAGPAPPARPGAAEGPVRGGRRAAGPAAHAGGAVRRAAHGRVRRLQLAQGPRHRGVTAGWLGRIRYRMGFAGYPTLRLMALAETGTRGLLGAALGSAADRDEATVARRLLPLLRPGHARPAGPGLRRQRVPARGRAPPGRCCWRGPSPPAARSCWVTCRTAPTCRDLDGLAVRIIEADVTVTGADGSRVRGQLPADHHADGPPPVPGRRGGPALPRAVGDRVGVFRAAAHPARGPRAALG